MTFFSENPAATAAAVKPRKQKPIERLLTLAEKQVASQEELVRQQTEENRVLLPFFAKQQGFDVQLDPETGQITGISQIRTPEMEQEEEIRNLFRERSLKALKGELPVDPALERSLGEQEEELRNRLQQQFGPGYETSTPGIQTLGEFFRSAEELRSGARTGQLTLAEQLGMTREQQEMFRQGTGQDVFRQFAIADPMAFAGALGQVSQGYLQAAAPRIQMQQFQASQDLAKKQMLAGIAGQALGAAGSILTGGVSKGGRWA